MKLFQVLNIWEWAVSHVVIIAGLALLTVGLSLGIVAATIGGIWTLAGGVCLTCFFVLPKLYKK